MQGRWRSFFFWLKLTLLSSLLLALLVAGLLLAQELRSAICQARFFADMAGKARYALGTGASPSIRFPQSAPFDDRLGYSQLPVFFSKLQAQDFKITQQSQISTDMASIVDQGYFAPYAEKTQAGLSILDCHNDSLFQERY